jgi:regulator of replication initiation timing
MYDALRNVMTLADLTQENKEMKEHIAQLQQELSTVKEENAQFRVALARILAVSKLAFKENAESTGGQA